MGKLCPIFMTPGGEEGVRQCKACGVDADLESKEDRFAEYVKSNRKKQITPVRSHLRKYKSGTITSVRGHWRCFTDKGRQILQGMGVDEAEIQNE